MRARRRAEEPVRTLYEEALGAPPVVPAPAVAPINLHMDEFRFAPQDFVTVKVMGVNYRGRVVRSIWQKGGVVYEVQYVDDRGEFKRGEFYDDELELRL